MWALTSQPVPTSSISSSSGTGLGRWAPFGLDHHMDAHNKVMQTVAATVYKLTAADTIKDGISELQDNTCLCVISSLSVS